jgi:hypothetical protein
MSRADAEDADGIEVPLELRGAFENPAELARLRRNAFDSVGRPYASGILYGMGLAQGLLDGLRAARRFGAGLGGAPRQAGPGLPLLFQIARLRVDRGFSGLLENSIEAAIHLRELGADTAPVCHVSAATARAGTQDCSVSSSWCGSFPASPTAQTRARSKRARLRPGSRRAIRRRRRCSPISTSAFARPR